MNKKVELFSEQEIDAILREIQLETAHNE